MAQKISREDSSYTQIKASAKGKELQKQQFIERKRNAIVLFLEFLRSEGYSQSVVQIENETNITLKNYQLCDNIDVLSVIAQFEEYYQFKFDKPVKMVKKLDYDPMRMDGQRHGSAQAKMRTPNVLDNIVQKNLGINTAAPIGAPPQMPSTKASDKVQQQFGGRPNDSKTPKALDQKDGKLLQQQQDNIDLSVQANPLTAKQVKSKSVDPRLQKESSDEEEEIYRPVLKAPPQNFPGELLPMYYLIQQEILQDHAFQKFSDVVGLDKPKQILVESVIFPQKYPELFSGILKPWKGCLLFSAPGNGKSFLARALAAECGCVFFNVSAASMLSKYYGESEKLVRCLFMMARQYERAVIFIDELDALMTKRSDAGDEHEAGRRLKTQLLVEIDGMMSQKTTSQVFVLCATNLPWLIDAAMLRRLEKRVYVPPLDLEGRIDLVKKNIGDRVALSGLIEEIAQRTDGWSSSDVVALCKEAAMEKLRKVIVGLEAGGKETSLKIGKEEVEKALAIVRPSYDPQLQKKYLEWMEQYGS